MAPKADSSSQYAKMGHQRCRRVAKLRSREAAAQLIQDTRVFARTVPPQEDFASEDHRQASNKLGATDPLPASSEYGVDQLTAAA